MSSNTAGNLAGGSSTTNPTSSGGTALPQSALVVTPSTFSFGAKSLSSTTSQTFTVYNQADITASITNVNLVGTMYSTTGDTCTGNTLAPATSCTISISFTPTSPGNFVAVVNIDFSSSFSTIVSTSFNMNGAGTGAQPTLTISPASYAFGNVSTNSSGANLFTISNPSSVTAYSVTPSISGTDFTILSQTCSGNNLSSGASCTVTVRFTPTATTSRAGSLRLDYNSFEALSYFDTAALTGTGVAPSVGFVFNGFNTPASDVSASTPTGAQLNWTAQPAATRYRITRVLPAPATVVITINTPATSSYVLTGLTPGESYQYRINAYDSLDVSDGNTNIASFTSPTGVSATFNGWSDVVATGSVYSTVGAVDTAWGNTPTGVAPAPPTWPAALSDSLHIVSTSTTKQNAVVKLAWDAFTFSAGGVSTSHKVYRGTTPGGPYTDITTAGSNVLSGYTFIDNGVSDETTYYYKIHPVQGTEITPAAASDTEIKVYVPPKNMNLIHRWIANREVCVNLLGKTFPTDFDRANNYRCNYVWGRSSAVPGCADPSIVDASCNHSFAPQIPWDQKAYWDTGYSLIVDRYEAGCKISAKAGSKASALPGGGFVDGDVFMGTGTSAGDNGGSALNGNCYLRSGGSWLSYALSTASAAQHITMSTNEPGYPPVSLTQGQAFNACNGRTVAGVGTLRLWRRHELVAGRAWQGIHNAPTTFLTALWTSGSDHATNGSCNTYSADGGSATSPIWNVPNNYWYNVTGSWATRNCKSRYEIQDTIGNMPEWTSDQLSGCNVQNTCMFGASSLDTGNKYLESFIFNNSMGKPWNPLARANYGYYGDGPTYIQHSSTMVPMYGVPTVSVDALLGSRTISASYMTLENIVNSTPVLIQGAADGFGSSFSQGRFGLGILIPTARTFFGYGLVPHVYGSVTHTGYRCVGQVP